MLPPANTVTSVAAIGSGSGSIPSPPVSLPVNTSTTSSSMFSPGPTLLAFLMIDIPPRGPWPIVVPSRSGLDMILSPAANPILAHLVQRIQTGEFIEMRELLADNIALHNQTMEFHGNASLAATPVSLRPRIREVPSLTSWMYCFLAYMAVRTRDPLTWDMLAYTRLVIREALRHGGDGWREYDRPFRRQVAIDPTITWNSLSPSLQASILIGSRNGPGTFCTICRESDHNSAHCALGILQQPIRPPPPSPGPRGAQRPYLNNRLPVCPPRRPETIRGICASWNRECCAYPGSCIFRHQCAVCD